MLGWAGGVAHLALQELLHFPEVLLMVILKDNLAPSQPELCIPGAGDDGVCLSEFLHIAWKRGKL